MQAYPQASRRMEDERLAGCAATNRSGNTLPAKPLTPVASYSLWQHRRVSAAAAIANATTPSAERDPSAIGDY